METLVIAGILFGFVATLVMAFVSFVTDKGNIWIFVPFSIFMWCIIYLPTSGMMKQSQLDQATYHLGITYEVTLPSGKTMILRDVTGISNYRGSITISRHHKPPIQMTGGSIVAIDP